MAKCPNCKGNNYVETPEIEACPDCGLFCGYHGGGPNGVYEDMMQRQADAEAEEELDKRSRWD